MKIFLSSDMEGTAGVVAWDQCVGDGPEAAAGRRLLLDEVNAAIEGAVAGGATEVVVNDSHYQMRNLPPGALAGQASYISGSHKPLYMMQGLDASFDAVLFVSYHGSVGAPAGLSHTYSPRTVVEARINGTVTGEAGINALVAAHYGVPVVLVTGDRCACEETAALIPGVHTAVVKEHVSRLAAHSLHPARACQLIR
jgi:D-amino peptidase